MSGELRLYMLPHNQTGLMECQMFTIEEGSLNVCQFVQVIDTTNTMYPTSLRKTFQWVSVEHPFTPAGVKVI